MLSPVPDIRIDRDDRSEYGAPRRDQAAPG